MVDLSQWTFSVIYSVDVPRGVRLTEYTPPDYSKHWDCTERVDGASGEETEYAYLDGEGSRSCWRIGRHRKHCAILTFDQFCDFIDHVGLYAENCSTMGSIGAPGFGVGWAPAIPFNSDDDEAIQTAYVTPCPPDKPVDPTPTFSEFPKDIDDDAYDWDSIEKLMWEWFDDGVYSARKCANECEKIREKLAMIT